MCGNSPGSCFINRLVKRFKTPDAEGIYSPVANKELKATPREKSHTMIVNELLSYAIFCHNANAVDNCKKVIIDFYNSDEIKAAKRSLWMECGNHLTENYQNRKSNENRTASTAYLEDIIKGIKELDAKGKLPDVVARDISRIPDRQPEQLNMLYVINQIEELKKASKNHQESLTSIKVEVMQLQDNAKNTAAHQDINNSAKASSKENEQNSEAPSQVLVGTNEQLQNNNSEGTGASAQENNEVIQQSTQVPRIEGRPWGPQRKNRESTHNQHRNQINHITEQQENSSANSAQVQQPHTENGTANTSVNHLEGAPLPQRSIFVSRVNRGDVHSIKMFLQDNNVDVVDITQTNHLQAKFKSFRIKVTMLDLNKVLNKNFWPRGILCKKWRDLNQRDNSSGSIDYSNDY